MSNPSDQTVELQPRVAYPKEITRGGRYDLTIWNELRSPWPYAEDSFQIGVMPAARDGVRVYATGTTMMRLDRDGACSKVRLEIVPTHVGETEIWLSLLTQGGIPFRNIRLPIKVNPMPLPMYVNENRLDGPTDTSFGLNFQVSDVPDTMRLGQEVEVHAALRLNDDVGLPLWEPSDSSQEEVMTWATLGVTEEVEVAGNGVAAMVMHRDGQIIPVSFRLTAKAPGIAQLRLRLIMDTQGQPVYADYQHTCTVEA